MVQTQLHAHLLPPTGSFITHTYISSTEDLISPLHINYVRMYTHPTYSVHTYVHTYVICYKTSYKRNYPKPNTRPHARPTPHPLLSDIT